MPNTRTVALSLPEAKRYADLSGVLADLAEVKRLCERFLRQIESSPDPNWSDLEVLCVAAIIRYGRTLTTGVRKGIDHRMTDKLGPVDQITHKLFRDLRDKWIAHSVNPFEENQLVVWLRPRYLPGPTVIGVAIHQTRVTSLGPPDMTRLLLLASGLETLVESELLLERDTVERIVADMDPAFLHNLPEAAQAKLPAMQVSCRTRRQ